MLVEKPDSWRWPEAWLPLLITFWTTGNIMKFMAELAGSDLCEASGRDRTVAAWRRGWV